MSKFNYRHEHIFTQLGEITLRKINVKQTSRAHENSHTGIQ